MARITPSWISLLQKKIYRLGTLIRSRSGINFDSNFIVSNDSNNDWTNISLSPTAGETQAEYIVNELTSTLPNAFKISETDNISFLYSGSYLGIDLANEININGNTRVASGSGNLTVGSSLNPANIYMEEDAKIGIGTTSPLTNLHIIGTNPTIRLAEVSSSPSEFIDVNDQSLQINKERDTGSALIDISPRPNDGTSGATLRMFRNTNTTGGVGLYVLKGDGTADVNHSLQGKGSSELSILGGNLSIGSTSNSANVLMQANSRIGIGTTTPEVSLHISGAANPALRVEEAIGGYGEFTNVSTGQSELRHVSTSGTSIITIDPKTDDRTSPVGINVFRNTNTTGDTVFRVNAGDGTFNPNHEFNGKGDAEICIDNGDVELGSASNEALVTSHGPISASMNIQCDSDDDNHTTQVAPCSRTNNSSVGNGQDRSYTVDQANDTLQRISWLVTFETSGSIFSTADIYSTHHADGSGVVTTIGSSSPIDPPVGITVEATGSTNTNELIITNNSGVTIPNIWVAPTVASEDLS